MNKAVSARFGLTARLVVLLMLAVLPGVVALVYTQAQLRADQDARVRVGATHQSQLLAANMNLAIDNGREVAVAIAALAATPDFADRCRPTLAELRGRLPAYALLELVRADGSVACAAGEAASVAFDTQVGAAGRAPGSTTGIFARLGHGTPVLPLFQPVLLNGQSAMIVVALDLAQLTRQLRDFVPVTRSCAFVADSGGTILLRLPDPNRYIGTAVPARLRLGPWAMAGKTRALRGLDGVKRLFAETPPRAPGEPFAVYGAYRVDPFLGLSEATWHGLLAVLLCTAALLLGLLAAARRLVSAPTEALLKAARRWGHGDLAARAVTTATPDSEFGRLALAFNGMAESLAHGHRTLQELNASLEARVADRTRSLSETNNRLLVEMNERERTDAAMRRSQKLQAVGQLAGGMAHEFNNLLTTIVGAFELIGLKLGPDHAGQRSLQAGMQSAERGARLTAQLLAFARRRRLTPIAVSLNAVIGEMRELLEGTVGRTVNLRLDLAEDLWPAVADRTEIEAAILNLVLNARDAMGYGGRLTLSTRNTELPRPGGHAEPRGEFVELTVEDDGAGMTEEELARAVEPFFTTKERGQGAGLGLSQVHGLAQQLGGDLHLASAKGQGTVISLLLPRAMAPAAVLEPLPPRHIPRRTAVLLVDDDDQVRQVTADMLTELGYDVDTAASGSAALDVLRWRREDRPFAALVIDYAMPGMTGIETIAKALQIKPDLGVLMITGFMDLDNGSEPLPIAPNQILHKPFTLGQLADRIAELSGRPLAMLA